MVKLSDLKEQQLNDLDNIELTNALQVDDIFTAKKDINIEGELSINIDEDNYTKIKENEIRLINKNGDYSYINQINDDKVLEVSLKDKDSNLLNSVVLHENDTTLKTSKTIFGEGDNKAKIENNMFYLNAKDYYFRINQDDTNAVVTLDLYNKDDNLLSRLILEDDQIKTGNKLKVGKSASIDKDLTINAGDSDKYVNINRNQVDMHCKNYYFSINKYDGDDDKRGELVIRDNDNNVINVITLGDENTTFSKDVVVNADIQIDPSSENHTIMSDNQIRLHTKSHYMAFNKYDGDEATGVIEIRDNDDNVKSQIAIGTGSTDFSNAVKIKDNKLTVNAGSDYYTEINSNDMIFGAGDDGGKAVFTKTNASTDCRLENQDKDGNILSRVKFTGSYVELGSPENSFHISTTSYKFDKLHGSDTKIKADTDLDTGWYTVATFGKNKGRGMARFMILDTKSSHHQVIDFQVTHMYGSDNSNNITIFQQAYYSNQVINKIRIKEKDTYDGAVVQVNIAQDENDLTVHYLGHNPLEDGWKIKNFIPDDTDPGDVDNYDDMTEKVRVNMSAKQSGMFMGRDLYFRESKGIQFMNDTDSGVNVAVHAEGEHFLIREPEDSNREWLKIVDDKEMYQRGSLVHTNRNRIFCSVYTDKSDIASDAKYPFNKKDADSHGAWDTDNYEFTCPRDGYYKVTWGNFIGSSDADVYRYYVRKNGDKIHGAHVRAIGADKDNYSPTSFRSIIIDCDKGDKIDIYFKSDNDKKDHGGNNYASLIIEILA